MLRLPLIAPEDSPRHRELEPVLSQFLMALVVLVLAVDIVFLARWTDLVRLPGEVTDLELTRQGAYNLTEYYEGLARGAGVNQDPQVQGLIESLRRKIGEADSSQEIIEIIGESERVQRVIMRAQDDRQRKLVLGILNDDPGVRSSADNGVLVTISGGEFPEMGPSVHQERPVLSRETVDAIEQHPELRPFSQFLQIEITNGKASLLTPVDQMEKMKLLMLEIDSLKRARSEANRLSGRTPLTGPGVIVKAYDVPGGYLWEEIVHERDIRDITNALLSAGSLGVEIGGQRLVATTSIKCVGPVVVVNQRYVAANPIVIEAVGDPDALAQSLISIQETFEATGKKLVVEKAGRVNLSAYEGK